MAEILPLQKSILLLRGDLGAGKTTFTRMLIKALGSEDEATSPTYSLVNEYDCPLGKIFHFDLYRLNSAIEVLDIGIEDYLKESYLSIIEWPDIYETELSDLPHHQLKIVPLPDGERKVFFS